MQKTNYLLAAGFSGAGKAEVEWKKCFEHV